MNVGVLEQSGQAQTPYWAMVTQEAMKYAGSSTVFITSLPSPLRGLKGGVVKECSPRLAAIGIVEQTHRIASEDEIRRYRAQGEENVQKLAQQEDDKRQRLALRSSGKDNKRDAVMMAAAIRTVMQEQHAQGPEDHPTLSTNNAPNTSALEPGPRKPGKQ